MVWLRDSLRDPPTGWLVHYDNGRRGKRKSNSLSKLHVLATRYYATMFLKFNEARPENEL